jgi:hypothetical protein
LDIDLKSIYIWPSGEVWFSLGNTFTSTNKASYGRGMLLSDQGYVVYHNLQLVGPFQPLEDLADFGLDALFVVTDVTPPPAAPKCVEAGIPPGTSDWRIRFEGSGRVGQLERSSDLLGPWTTVGGVTPAQEFTDPGVVTNQTRAFYRLRSW